MNIRSEVKALLGEFSQTDLKQTPRQITNQLLALSNTLHEHYKTRDVYNLTRVVNAVLKDIKPTQDYHTVVDNAPKEIRTRYEIRNGEHIFFPQKGVFKLSNEIIDKLFYSFSKHGLDQSQTEILNDFNLEPWQWHAIKSALRLYKMSNIFSNHTLESKTPEEVRELVRAKMDEKINQTGYIVEQEYKKSVYAKYKDVIRKKTTADLTLSTLLLELQDLMTTLPKVTLTIGEQAPRSFANQEDDLVIALADLHYGSNNASTGAECLLPEFNTEILKGRMNQIADYINSKSAKRVHILNAGDIIETFSGNNHSGVWKGIEQGKYGATVVIEVAHLLIEFLSKIHNLASYSQVPGNHDRTSSSNSEEPEGFVARIVFEFIKNAFANTPVEMTYDELMIAKNFGGVNYLLSHGHKRLSAVTPSDLILKYAPNVKDFTILLKGHVHHRDVLQDHENFRSLILPSLVANNHYSISEGYSSTAGFLTIEKGFNNKPIVTDIGL